MNDNTIARMRVAALVYSMVNAVVFGIGVVTVLSVPALSAHAFFWIPAVVVTSFGLAAPLSWGMNSRRSSACSWRASS